MTEGAPAPAGPRLGIAFTPDRPPEQLRALALAADAAGLDDLWVWEDCFKESGVASAAAALAWTSRITVGIGLLPAPLRAAALTAMELAVLGRTFPGRFLGGIGHGVQDWMEQAGVRVASPLTLLREQVGAVRRLLDGETVTVEGRYVTLRDVSLDWPPTERVPLLLGGSGPKALALTGELGDGTLLSNALSVAEVAAAVERVGEAVAARPDAAGHRHAVVATVIGAVGEGARDRVDRELANWGPGPSRDAAVGGTVEEVVAHVRALAGAGATTVVVQPTADEPDPDGLVRLLGQQVRPMLG